MTLNELKNHLQGLEILLFQLPSGELVPAHFHVTEVGKVTKDFIDCGGVFRKEEKISLQLWEANDYDHRLHPEKLVKILNLAENQLQLENLELELEYQGATIQKYGLEFSDKKFILTSTQTDCLAKGNCGIPKEKKKVSLANSANSCCSNDSECC